MTAAGRQRIDKWLWFARLAKTRTLAQKLATSGSVRVNRVRNQSASRPVKTGDVLTVALRSGVRVIRIVDLGTRRGPPADARLLYKDLSPPPTPTTQETRTRGAGRPTKRDRRVLMALKQPAGRDFPARDE